MENIIPISRSNGFEYSVVLLPKEAYGIHQEMSWLGNSSLKYRINSYIGFSLPLEKEFGIVGILNESISEDQAREIVDMQNKEFPSHVVFRKLKSLIESNGIKTENPLKKPEKNPYGACFNGSDYEAMDELEDRFQEKLKAWESSEREIKKCLVLKTKI